MQEDVSDSWGEPLGLALEPGTQVAGFTVEAQLGTGGAGTIYRASRGGHRVALKVIPRNAWGEREVDALRRVHHPHVVGLLGYGTWPEHHPRYLVLTLELIEGLALDDWAQEHNPSARQLVHQVLLPLVRALGEVHAAGVVHRDVKEANILIREADGQPVLVDFGSAHYHGAARLTDRLPPGTREYRSPEQLRFAHDWEGEHYPSSPADDLWALGVTFYWLLTRELPFGDRTGALFKSILEQAPPPVPMLNPRVPKALGELCLRMLAKEPVDRYRTASDLAQALEALLARANGYWDVPLFSPEPASAESSIPAPAARPQRRTRAVVGGALLAGVLGLLSWRLAHGPTTPPEAPPAPRTASSREAPVPQEGMRQEVARGDTTAEVGSSAGPLKSPPPAPVARATHPEDTAVLKSHKARSTVTATLAAATLCGGCVSAPQPMKPPPAPIPCPAGASRTYISHRTGRGASIFFESAPNGAGMVRNGALRVQLLKTWGDFPVDTPLLGHAWFSGNRVYGRLTQVLLASGDRLPICLDLDFNGPGVPMEAGSTRTVAFINNSSGAIVVPESTKE